MKRKRDIGEFSGATDRNAGADCTPHHSRVLSTFDVRADIAKQHKGGMRSNTTSCYAGFVFTDDERQKEGERASEYLHRFTTDALHQFMDILDLPRGADKKVRCIYPAT